MSGVGCLFAGVVVCFSDVLALGSVGKKVATKLARRQWESALKSAIQRRRGSVNDVERDDALPQNPEVQPRVSAAATSSLRGPAVAGVGRQFWLVVSALGLVIFAVVLVVSFVSTANDNARISRLKLHGIPVAVSVTECFGNLGGSGSNAADYTCHGSYRVAGVRYEELIGSMTSFSRPGTIVRGVVDPSRHDAVVLATAVSSSSTSSGTFVIESFLSLVFLLLTWLFVRVARRTASPRESVVGGVG